MMTKLGRILEKVKGRVRAIYSSSTIQKRHLEETVRSANIGAYYVPLTTHKPSEFNQLFLATNPKHVEHGFRTRALRLLSPRDRNIRLSTYSNRINRLSTHLGHSGS